jgi:hypothetical protein
VAGQLATQRWGASYLRSWPAGRHAIRICV